MSKRQRLSAREIRRLGDWVLRTHESVINHDWSCSQVCAAACEQLPTGEVFADDLQVAYESVGIDWPSSWVAVESRDKEIATIARAVAGLCHAKGLQDTLYAIADRLSPEPASHADLVVADALCILQDEFESVISEFANTYRPSELSEDTKTWSMFVRTDVEEIMERLFKEPPP
jgi:hypothetical protein